MGISQLTLSSSQDARTCSETLGMAPLSPPLRCLLHLSQELGGVKRGWMELVEADCSALGSSTIFLMPSVRQTSLQWPSHKLCEDSEFLNHL